MIKYVVQSGDRDTLSGIAYRYGIADWRRAIYEHPANTAFRRRRPDPNLIYPGDELVLPVEVAPSDPREKLRWTLKVEPIESTLGVQQRLNNAGFDAGPEDGVSGPLTEAGIRRFQKYCKEFCHLGNPRMIDPGPVDGIFGPLTEAALRGYYGV